MKNVVLLTVCLFVVVVSFIGCETIKGIGKDIANTGDNIQDAVGNVMEGSSK